MTSLLRNYHEPSLLRPNPRRRRLSWRVVILIIVLLIIIVWFGRPLFAPLEWLSLGLRQKFGWSFASLGGDGAAAERARLAAELSALDRLARDNAELRAELGLLAGPTPLIIAQVLPDLGPAPYGVIRAAVGEGVRVPNGARVRSGGVLLGTVLSQSGQVLKIALYSAPGRQTAAWLEASTTPLTLVGQGTDSFTAVAPRNLAVTIGDWALLGADDRPGLPAAFGRVEAIESDPAESLQTIYFGLPFASKQLRYVEIEP